MLPADPRWTESVQFFLSLKLRQHCLWKEIAGKEAMELPQGYPELAVGRRTAKANQVVWGELKRMKSKKGIESSLLSVATWISDTAGTMVR